MLFNSTFFLFVFLPVVLAGFFWIQHSRRAGLLVPWLIGASLFFYAWAQPALLLLLLGSVAVNFTLGLWIQDAGTDARKRGLCALGVTFDLALLGVFKYADFAVTSVAPDLAAHWRLDAIVLPLAISFFTFQQIAYLSDTRHGRVAERRFTHYLLFVTFFPKLVAGPIVHHDEMLDQLHALPGRRVDVRDLAVGLTLFTMGLFKKVVLADAVAGQTAPLFDLAATGVELTFLEAWMAALGFTFQVYFDFSGYSDMAIGLARCFGITLPLNFHSPYKALDISEFWRRWHVTLTRWLRLYLFIPTSRRIMRRGGERFDTLAVVVAQAVTMTLCGLWHGAGWNFVLWGALHGALLVGHDGWLALKRRLRLSGLLPEPLAAVLARATLLLVLAATFVVFRAPDLATAGAILSGMVDPVTGFEADALARATASIGLSGAALVVVFTAIVWLLPNTQQLLADEKPVLDMQRFRDAPVDPRLRWRPNPTWAVIVLAMALGSVYFILVEGYEEFIYRFF